MRTGCVPSPSKCLSCRHAASSHEPELFFKKELLGMPSLLLRCGTCDKARKDLPSMLSLPKYETSQDFPSFGSH